MLLLRTGLVVFVAQLRRPVVAVLDEVFHQGMLLSVTPGHAWGESLDELLLFSALLPLALTNLKKQCRRHLSCSDASERRGGAGESKSFVNVLEQLASVVVDDTMAALLKESPWGNSGGWNEAYACAACGAMPSDAGAFLRPKRCGAICCGLPWLVEHSEKLCCLRAWVAPDS